MKTKEIADRLRRLADELDGVVPTAPHSDFTFEQVRSVAIEKSRDGKSSKVQDLLKFHGVDKLSALPEREYPSFYEKVVAL